MTNDWVRGKNYEVEVFDGIEYVGYYYSAQDVEDGEVDIDTAILTKLGIAYRYVPEPDGASLLVPYDRITADGDWV